MVTEPYVVQIARRVAAPKVCPICGKSNPQTGAGEGLTGMDAISVVMHYYYNKQISSVTYEKDPFWRMKRWVYRCNHATRLHAAVYSENPFLALVKQRANLQTP